MQYYNAEIQAWSSLKILFSAVFYELRFIKRGEYEE